MVGRICLDRSVVSDWGSYFHVAHVGPLWEGLALSPSGPFNRSADHDRVAVLRKEAAARHMRVDTGLTWNVLTNIVNSAMFVKLEPAILPAKALVGAALGGHLWGNSLDGPSAGSETRARRPNLKARSWTAGCTAVFPTPSCGMPTPADMGCQSFPNKQQHLQEHDTVRFHNNSRTI